MTQHELDSFLEIWDHEATKTIQLLKALPKDQYDFRPDPGGRSLGELAWHLAEGDAYMTCGVAQGAFELGMKPPGIERPRQVEALAPGFERVHADATARIRKMKPEDLDRKLKFFNGQDMTGSEILWFGVLHHQLHHRGQLSLLCRLAGGVPPGMYGPNREEWAEMQAKMGAQQAQK